MGVSKDAPKADLQCKSASVGAPRKLGPASERRTQAADDWSAFCFQRFSIRVATKGRPRPSDFVVSFPTGAAEDNTLASLCPRRIFAPFTRFCGSGLSRKVLHRCLPFHVLFLGPAGSWPSSGSPARYKPHRQSENKRGTLQEEISVMHFTFCCSRGMKRAHTERTKVRIIFNTGRPRISFA
jgi:hypothetical protein